MFLFLRPKYIKQGKLYIREAQKRVNYNRDVWSEQTVADFDAQIAKLKAALKARDREAAAEAERAIDALCTAHCPAGKDAWLSENTEVILVAIIVALGIRTYFLQPFTIPTSSMQPTLFGITGQATKDAPPNVLKQAFDWVAAGRTWHEVVAEADETITEYGEARRGGLRRIFTYTRIHTNMGNEYWVNELPDPVAKIWGEGRGEMVDGKGRPTMKGMSFKKGEPIVRGFTDTGDHVFVDKMSYHFRRPSRGEVFVFTTANIPAMGNPGPPPRQHSQFYIKRLCAVPGDTARIAPPQLFINGERASEPGIARVMSGTREKPVDDYAGYGPGPGSFQEWSLGSSSQEYKLPEKSYYALGDNSYASSDSRYWGTVPEQNLMGTGVFVYWPFTRAAGGRWGIIR